METTAATNHIFTTAEAVQHIKKTTKKGIYICVNVPLPILSKEGYSFPGYGTLKVSRSRAINFVKDVLTNFEERGARIKMREYSNILFIG